MKIESSNVNLAASHTSMQRTETQTTQRAWVGNLRPDAPGAPDMASAAFVVSLSNAVISATQADPIPTSPTTLQTIADASDKARSDPRLMLLILMIEKLTGKPVRLASLDLDASDGKPCLPDPSECRIAPSEDVPSPPQGAGFGIEYDSREIREEHEQLQFSAQGVVRTTDGKEIRFDLSLAMERSWHEESTVSLRAGDAIRKDPLVINFDGTAAQLRGGHFRFDLDGDGKEEDMPTLSGGSGYLALDLNGNGKIDSGKELFGAASGDGFADLARNDSDGNGWIDENDPVFAQLRVWTPSGDGEGNLDALEKHDVGALFLNRVQTPFELRGTANADLGALRGSGIYLKEDGGVGSLQQIDVTV